MVKRRSFVIAFVLLVGAIIIVPLLLRNDKTKIKKQFTKLTEIIAKEPGESVIATAAKVHGMAALFAPTCQLKTGVSFLDGTFQRTEVGQVIASLRSRFSDLSLRFSDITIELTEDDTADVTLTGRMTGQMIGGDSVDEYRELKCVLKKIEREWVFSSCEVVKVLEKQ